MIRYWDRLCQVFFELFFYWRLKLGQAYLILANKRNAYFWQSHSSDHLAQASAPDIRQTTCTSKRTGE